VPLRIDSLAFVATALLSVAAMRLAPRAHALRAYALLSLGLWLASIGNLVAALLALCFLFLPIAVVGVRRNLPGWAKALLFTVQIGQLLWLRRYVPAAALPAGVVVVGVSYMLLRQIEWLLWIDAADAEPVAWVEYTAFTAGVFTLLAGPIARYRDFRAGFAATPSDETGLVQSLHRVVNGYFKAALIAPVLGEFTRSEWLLEHASSPWAVAWFVLSYPFYLYLNFAGYCDIVIGLARLGHFRLPENFDQPFFATNIRDFWGRWHMTFSNWIRVHVFFPLVRFTRTGPVRLPELPAVALSVVLTFLIVGAWHGPKLGFLVFGLMHAAGMLAVSPYGWLLDRILSERGRAIYETNLWVRAARIGTCFGYVALSMLFFERDPAEVKALFDRVF
jgi:D-alanyl-lipoteichoic acid acyltransferase DltB (MBOAT superfamily)